MSSLKPEEVRDVLKRLLRLWFSSDRGERDIVNTISRYLEMEIINSDCLYEWRIAEQWQGKVAARNSDLEPEAVPDVTFEICQLVLDEDLTLSYAIKCLESCTHAGPLCGNRDNINSEENQRKIMALQAIVKLESEVEDLEGVSRWIRLVRSLICFRFELQDQYQKKVEGNNGKFRTILEKYKINNDKWDAAIKGALEDSFFSKLLRAMQLGVIPFLDKDLFVSFQIYNPFYRAFFYRGIQNTLCSPAYEEGIKGNLREQVDSVDFDKRLPDSDDDQLLLSLASVPQCLKQSSSSMAQSTLKTGKTRFFIKEKREGLQGTLHHDPCKFNSNAEELLYLFENASTVYDEYGKIVICTIPAVSFGQRRGVLGFVEKTARQETDADSHKYMLRYIEDVLSSEICVAIEKEYQRCFEKEVLEEVGGDGGNIYFNFLKACLENIPFILNVVAAKLWVGNDDDATYFGFTKKPLGMYSNNDFPCKFGMVMEKSSITSYQNFFKQLDTKTAWETVDSKAEQGFSELQFRDVFSETQVNKIWGGENNPHLLATGNASVVDLTYRSSDGKKSVIYNIRLLVDSPRHLLRIHNYAINRKFKDIDRLAEKFAEATEMAKGIGQNKIIRAFRHEVGRYYTDIIDISTVAFLDCFEQDGNKFSCKGGIDPNTAGDWKLIPSATLLDIYKDLVKIYTLGDGAMASIAEGLSADINDLVPLDRLIREKLIPIAINSALARFFLKNSTIGDLLDVGKRKNLFAPVATKTDVLRDKTEIVGNFKSYGINFSGIGREIAPPSLFFIQAFLAGLTNAYEHMLHINNLDLKGVICSLILTEENGDLKFEIRNFWPDKRQFPMDKIVNEFTIGTFAIMAEIVQKLPRGYLKPFQEIEKNVDEDDLFFRTLFGCQNIFKEIS